MAFLRKTLNSLDTRAVNFCLRDGPALELHHNVSVRLEMDSDSARHIPQRRGPCGLKHIEIRCLAFQQWIRKKKKRLSVELVDTKDSTAYLFAKHLDGPRTRSLARKLGLRIL